MRKKRDPPTKRWRNEKGGPPIKVEGVEKERGPTRKVDRSEKRGPSPRKVEEMEKRRSTKKSGWIEKRDCHQGEGKCRKREFNNPTK